MNKDVDEYIKNLDQQWQRGVVSKLRKLVHEADTNVQETLKWGTPTFERNGIVAWLFCAKEWVHFSFPQGVLLDNKHDLFEPTSNKAKRTIKIREGDKIPDTKIVQLYKEAVKINTSGQKITFRADTKQPIIIPENIMDELRSHGLTDEYFSRPYYQQKGYMQWIGQAKREETRTKRIAKMLEELQEDSYMPPKNKKGG